MAEVRIACPNSSCAKQLVISLKPGTERCKARCRACGTTFMISIAPPAQDLAPLEPVARRSFSDDDEEYSGGSYGLAEETSLTYLLRREEDGLKLTSEEKATKKRLIAEKLAANPRQCPACEGKMARKAIVCLGCGLNLETGKRLKTTVEKEEKKYSSDGVEIAAAAGAALDVADIIITILGSAGG